MKTQALFSIALLFCVGGLHAKRSRSTELLGGETWLCVTREKNGLLEEVNRPPKRIQWYLAARRMQDTGSTIAYEGLRAGKTVCNLSGTAASMLVTGAGSFVASSADFAKAGLGLFGTWYGHKVVARARSGR